MQYPGVALLLCFALHRRRWRLLATATLSSLFLFPVPAAVLRFYYHQHEQWPNAPGLMYLWTSVTPLASLLFLGLLLSTLGNRAMVPEAQRKPVAIIEA
jgi:hypothetical protein